MRLMIHHLHIAAAVLIVKALVLMIVRWLVIALGILLD